MQGTGLQAIATALQNVAVNLGRLIAQTSLSIVVPIIQGGTGATTAAGGRANLGIGTLGTQDAGAVVITGGSIDGANFGQVAPADVTATVLVNTAETADQSGSHQIPLTGFTITVPNGCSWLDLAPAATLASGTVVMPIGPIDGQDVIISSTQTISSLTVSPNGGQTLDGAPTTIAANAALWWRYRASITTWRRML